jgi:hypothetical protein
MLRLVKDTSSTLVVSLDLSIVITWVTTIRFPLSNNAAKKTSLSLSDSKLGEGVDYLLECDMNFIGRSHTDLSFEKRLVKALKMLFRLRVARKKYIHLHSILQDHRVGGGAR